MTNTPEHMAMMRAKAKEVKTLETKKKVSWRPAKLLDTISGLDQKRFRYRWGEKDAAELAKKLAEGWSVTKDLDGNKVEHQVPDTLSERDGRGMTPSITEYRELILLQMPEEVAKARDEYYQNITDGTEDALKRNLEDKARSLGGNVEGSIRLPTRIIE